MQSGDASLNIFFISVQNHFVLKLKTSLVEHYELGKVLFDASNSKSSPKEFIGKQLNSLETVMAHALLATGIQTLSLEPSLLFPMWMLVAFLNSFHLQVFDLLCIKVCGSSST